MKGKTDEPSLYRKALYTIDLTVIKTPDNGEKIKGDHSFIHDYLDTNVDRTSMNLWPSNQYSTWSWFLSSGVMHPCVLYPVPWYQGKPLYRSHVRKT
jgi:hypothetical protein